MDFNLQKYVARYESAIFPDVHPVEGF
jgi:hypothetical protein